MFRSPFTIARHLSLGRPFFPRSTPEKAGDNCFRVFTQSPFPSPQSSMPTPFLCRWLIPVILCLSITTLATPARAHRVLVFAFAQDDTIHTESKFVGSGAVQKGQVQVQDKASGKVLVTGTTDDQGKFFFKIPPEAVSERLDLLIIVGASLGHQGEWLLKADSYLPKTDKMAAAAPNVPKPVTPSSPAAGTPGTKVAAVDQQALEEVLNNVMERQLGPIKDMLADLTVRRRTFPEIIGGLGYIAGIFGVVAYFMSKKQPKP
jgi:nickel transport protein